MNAWLAALMAQLRAAPRKAALLGALLVLLVGVLARAFLAGGPPPATATAAPVAGPRLVPPVQPQGRDRDALAGTTGAPRVDGTTPAAVAGWDGTDGVSIAGLSRVLRRDLFETDWCASAPKADNLTRSASGKDAEGESTLWRVACQAWTRAMSHRQRLERAREAVHAEAARFRLTGTFLGQRPRAVIDGQMLQVGEIIGGFRITHIGAHHVELHKSGWNVRLTMP